MALKAQLSIKIMGLVAPKIGREHQFITAGLAPAPGSILHELPTNALTAPQTIHYHAFNDANLPPTVHQQRHHNQRIAAEQLILVKTAENSTVRPAVDALKIDSKALTGIGMIAGRLIIKGIIEAK